MPIVTIYLRARDSHVDLSTASQIWGCTFHGRCRGKPVGAVNPLAGACASVTLHEWPQAAQREPVPAWISEESLGALYVMMWDQESGEHMLSASLRVPNNVYRKALEADFSQDELLLNIEFGELSAAGSGQNATIKSVRVHFHTRNDPEHGLFGPFKFVELDD
jgi:hypothetical protein